MLNIIGWIKDIMNKIKDDHVTAYAAQSAFFIILSAVPFLMLLLILLNHVPIETETLITNINDFFSGRYQRFYQCHHSGNQYKNLWNGPVHYYYRPFMDFRQGHSCPDPWTELCIRH